MYLWLNRNGKCKHDILVIGLQRYKTGSVHYRREREWVENNLLLNLSRTEWLILRKSRQRHKPVCASVQLRCSRWTDLGSWNSASKTTCQCLHTSPPWCRKSTEMDQLLTETLRRSNSGARFLFLCATQDRKALQRVIQTLHKYLLPFHSTTEQLQEGHNLLLHNDNSVNLESLRISGLTFQPVKPSNQHVRFFPSTFHNSTGLFEVSALIMETPVKEICSHHYITAYFMTAYALHEPSGAFLHSGVSSWWICISVSPCLRRRWEEKRAGE